MTSLLALLVTLLAAQGSLAWAANTRRDTAASRAANRKMREACSHFKCYTCSSIGDPPECMACCHIG